MRIVIPTNDGINVADHFGRCKNYVFLNEEGEVIELIDNTSEHMGGKGLPPELMKQYNADILLCKGIGFRALNLCKQLGIKVYVHQASTVKEIFDLWKNKKLKQAGSENACKEHGK